MSEAGYVPSPESAAALGQFELALQRMTPRVFVTWALVAANVAVFAIMIATGVDFMSPTVASLLTWGADFAPKTLGGEWWRMITCTFVHIGVFHILMNMIVLADAGRLVERLLGNAGFAAMYLASGIGGSLASLWWSPDVVSAGASGAVFGVYGALIAVIVREGKSIPRVRLERLTRSAAGFVIYNVLYGARIKGIDMAAHFGGLATGFLCGLALARPIRASERTSWPNVAGVMALAAVLLFGGPRLLPHARADAQAELERFEQVEKDCFDRYNGALKDVREHRLDPAGLADRIEKEVLPPWQEARRRIEALADLPPEVAARMAKIVEYMKKREEAWTTFARGARASDNALMEKGSALQKEAEALAKSISDG